MGATPFPGLLHFTLDSHLIVMSAKQGGIKYHFFLVFGITRPGIEPRSPGPLANTLLIRPRQFFVMLYSVGGLTRKRYFQRVIHS